MQNNTHYRALYRIRRGGEETIGVLSHHSKHKKSTVKSTEDFVGKVIPFQEKCSPVTSRTTEVNVDKQQTHI